MVVQRSGQEYWYQGKIHLDLSLVGSAIAGEGIGYSLQYVWASLVVQWVKNCLQCRRPGFDPWVGKIPWRRERLCTPVFWPGELHGQRSLAGYFPWGCKELDMTEQLSLIFKELSNLISPPKDFYFQLFDY